MASIVTEEQIINKLAETCLTIEGITNAYGFAQIPDSLANSALPAIIFYPSAGFQERKGHHNRWTNTIEITGLLFVTERMSKGGSIKYIDNATLPFAQRFRQKFQTASVYNDFINLGLQVADFTRYQYGSGGQLLFMDKDYVGFVFTWEFRSTA